MKRSLAALFALLLLFLSGCHGSKTQSSFLMPEAFDDTQEFELSFWAKNDTNKTQVKIYEDAIAGFEKLYPNIHINLRLYTDYARIYNDVITNISTGTTPNICITYPDHIATYLTGENTVMPLDPLIADSSYGLGGSALRFDSPKRSELVQTYYQEGFFDGNCYALPFMRSTEACYINKTYVEQLGYTLPEMLTWDFIWEVSEAATAKNADGTYRLNGQNVLIPFLYKSTDNMMIQMLRQKNLPYSDAAGNVLLFHDDTASLLKTIAEHTESGAFSTFKISGYPANFLNAGQCIFAVDSTAGSTWMGSNAPLSDIGDERTVRFETAVMSVPQFDEDNIQMISQGPSLCIFRKENPQEVLASWLFTQYLLTNEIQIAYAQTEGYVPVTEKARQSEAYRNYLSLAGSDNDLHYSVKMEATELLLKNTEHLFVTPVFNGSASLRDSAGQLIETVTKSTRRKESIQYDSLFASVRGLYHLDQISAQNGGKTELGKLPAASVIFLASLAAVWCILIGFCLFRHIRRRKD